MSTPSITNGPTSSSLPIDPKHSTLITSDPPPPYDTLSLCPPEAETSTPASLSLTSTHPSQPTTKASSSLSQKFKNLKSENERRKAEQVVHVSKEEADRITGLDRHWKREERKDEEGRKRSGKGLFGLLALS